VFFSAKQDDQSWPWPLCATSPNFELYRKEFGPMSIAMVGLRYWFGLGCNPATLLYGAGNGLLTIARGTVPLAIFGAHGYGERTELLGAPARAAQALASLLFGTNGEVGLIRTLCLGGLMRLPHWAR
jgi:hypothetical protein